jgi:DNA-binding NarL/FixJ family response regulator
MTAIHMPSVLIIGDDVLIRQGLRSLLEQDYRGVLFGEAMVAQYALTEIAKRKWDLIILDISNPSKDGLSLLDKIQRRDSLAPVLVLSSGSDLRQVARAQQLGAAGFSPKDASREDLSRALKDILAGRRNFGRFPGDSRTLSRDLKSLSPRESRVMLALASGKRTIDIASDLNLSTKTVSTYRRRVLDKLMLDSTADLVRHVVYHKLSDAAR